MNIFIASRYLRWDSGHLKNAVSSEKKLGEDVNFLLLPCVQFRSCQFKQMNVNIRHETII